MERVELWNLVQNLSQFKSANTSLISLYIPYDKNILSVISQMRQELSRADNIQSDSLRDCIKSRIRTVTNALGQIKHSNGLIVFCGEDLWIIEPHFKLNTSFYKCDKFFHTELLENVLRESDDVVGVIAIDARDCGWGIVRNGILEVLDHTSSGVAGKTRKGGSSARRYERCREMHIHEYFIRCGDMTNDIFKDIKKIVIHGPAFTKHQFVESKTMNYMILNKIQDYSDGCYAGEDGLYEYKNTLV